MKKYLSIFFFFLSIATYATHYRAGEITYKWMGGYQYEFTVITYTNTCNTLSDDPDVEIYFGDGGHVTAPRSNGNGNGVIISSCFRRNEYTATYLYGGPGNYVIHIEQPNRKAGIENLPNSLNTPFYIQTYLKINNLLMGHNNSPVLLYPPVDSACLYQCFTHNPVAYDPDGDSLSYSIFNCLGSNGAQIPGYTIPSGVTVNPVTGDLTWCSPQPSGNTYPQDYNFAMIIHEWRRYNHVWYEIGYVERDLEVDVLNNCNNTPPVVFAEDTCVLAGTLLTMMDSAHDAEGNQLILTASGGPFTLNPSATYTPVSTTQLPTAFGTFSWNTTCDFVRKYPYQVQYKAKDISSPVSLSGFKSVFITVIAPAPQNLTASAKCNSVTLSWSAETCDPVGNKLTGYKIYRKSDCDPWNPSVCETGVPASSGYSFIGLSVVPNYIDNNLSFGVNYSYRVTAIFLDEAESYASSPVCIKLKQEVPILTNVDVTATNNPGSIDVRWIKPIGDINNFDTTRYLPPYKYELYGSAGYTNASVLLATFTANAFSGPNGLNVTSYTDNTPNTVNTPYVYRLDFFSQDTLLCTNKSASSVYLSLIPNDNQIALSWNFNVPWSNYQYDVYRSIPSLSIPYTLIGTTTTTTYLDTALANGRTYCYKIKAYGKYSDPTLPAPLINWSEEKCGVPIDLTPPCAPALSITSDCNSSQNDLAWTNPNQSCADDVVGYNIFYTPTLSGDYQLIATINSANIITFIHDSLNSVAGCYVVAAVDSFGNQSAFSNKACVDNCPVYDLPNVFTPNGDGINDLFVPFPYRYVKDIELKIFNRWGDLVFTSNDPQIKWDGTHMKSKQLLSDGVYYFTCNVNEIRLSGIEPRMIKGFVQILSAKQ